MDLATLKVASGTFSYNEAIRDCVRMLSKSGLRSVDYASGRSYEIESAARMIVRTAMSQLAGQITMMNCEKTGQDLVYVDEHAGARPEHAIWQGAVYSRSGKSKKYADFYKATDYGSPTGLKGVNCSHNFYPYWDGDALPEHIETPDVEYNGESMTYYEATQEQRAMERNIRQLNRELNATKAMGLDTTELQKKFNSAVDKYADFSMQTGIRAKADRLGGAWSNMTKESRRGLMDAKAYQFQYAMKSLKELGLSYKNKKTVGEWNNFNDAVMSIMLHNCGNKDLIDLYEKNATMFVIGNSNYDGVPHVDKNGKININLRNVIYGDEIHKPYEQLFHEMAHVINNSKGNGTFTESYVNRDGHTLYDVLQKDLFNLRYEATKVYNLSEKSIDEIDNALIKMLQNEAKGMSQAACVSDTLEGLIGQCLWIENDAGYSESAGHGFDYWISGGGKSVKIPDEFFAKYCQTTISNYESLSFMLRTFPESMEFVDNMLRDLL